MEDKLKNLVGRSFVCCILGIIGMCYKPEVAQYIASIVSLLILGVHGEGAYTAKFKNGKVDIEAKQSDDQKGDIK
jgi:hypothetical protein